MPVKKHSMDAKLISLKQTYEINYIHLKYDIPKDVLRPIVKAMRGSRIRTYRRLREIGYDHLPYSKRELMKSPKVTGDFL